MIFFRLFLIWQIKSDIECFILPGKSGVLEEILLD